MTTIILLVALAIFGLLVFKYFSSKGKRHSEKSSVEKIVSTIGRKIGRNLDSAAEGMRNCETVKTELLSSIDKAKKKLVNDFGDYLNSMITSRETHKSIIENAKNRRESLTKKAKEYKKKYEEEKDVKYKNITDKYISSIIINEKMIKNSEVEKEKCISAIEDSETEFDLMKVELESKRCEIISMTTSPESSLSLSKLNIADLTSEFKEKMQKKIIDVEVKTIMNNDETTTSINNVSDEEIIQRYGKL